MCIRDRLFPAGPGHAEALFQTAAGGAGNNFLQLSGGHRDLTVHPLQRRHDSLIAEQGDEGTDPIHRCQSHDEPQNDLPRRFRKQSVEIQQKRRSPLNGYAPQDVYKRQALESAKKSARDKSVFFSRVSHDMRTPLNAVIGLSDLALEHRDDKEKMAGYLEKIRQAGKQLLTLINDILDMSRIDQGTGSLDNQATDLEQDVYKRQL